MSQQAFSLASPSPDTLAVSGDLTFATAARALETARAELERSSASSLDLAGVTHADSAGLATILALLAHVRTKGRTLSVTHAPEGLLALARVSGVDDLL